MLKAVVFAFVAGTVVCPVVMADQIILNNGDRLTGAIVKSDDKNLTIKADLAGSVTVPWEAIEQISSTEPLYLTLKDSQMLVGTVTTGAGKLEVRTSDAGAVTISKDSIHSVRSKDEQTAYQADVDRLRNPGLLDLWSGAVDAGLSLTRGNADTTTFALGMAAARTTRRDKLSVYAEALVGQELSHKLSGRTSLRERLVFFPNLSETGEYRLNFDVSAVTSLSKWLAWQVTLGDRYLSNPVAGAKKNDLLLTTGIRVTFAR